MKSFGLIRTNPALTTNIKVVVDSNYKLTLESFDSVSDLSNQQFKAVPFNKDNLYDELIGFFFKDVTPDVGYAVKYDNDADKMGDDFTNQFDDIYYMGCDNILNTDYNEEFECFAPLHINPKQLPKYMVIMRVDGAGIMDLSKDNFRDEVLENFKVIKTFDLTRNTPLGEWLETNYTKNVDFPDGPFDIDIRDSEFSLWKGIDYSSGGYVERPFYMDEQIEKENTFFEFDKYITDGYKNNKVVYPNILNLKFLFDDTPATATSLRKWSVNRYYGFYLNDVDLVTTVTPYSPPEINKNFTIVDDNFLIKTVDSGSNSWIGPNDTPLRRDWDDKISYWLEIGGDFYRLTRKFKESDGPFVEILVENGEPLYEYQLVSDIDLSDREDEINRSVIEFNASGTVNNNSIIFDSKFNPGSFTDRKHLITSDEYGTADMWIIEIDGLWHSFKYDVDNDEFYINTDWTFKIFNNKLRYWVNSSNSDSTAKGFVPQTQIDMKASVNNSTPPVTFKIFKCQLTDIMDFDTDIVDTEFSKFEYEEKEDITFTDEIKLYVDNVDSLGEPKPLDEFEYKDEIILIPAASEYSSTREMFEVETDSNLTALWRKNALSPKWGYMNSISHNDYPYRYNNNLKADIFNKAPNTLVKTPSRVDRNLDYFYTINPDDNKYINHSLHITDVIDVSASNFNLDTNFKFEVDRYFNTKDIQTFGSIFSVLQDTIFTTSPSYNIGSHSLKVGDKVRVENVVVTNNVVGTLNGEQTIIRIDGSRIITDKKVVGDVSASGITGQVIHIYSSDYFSYLFGKKEYLSDGELIRCSNKHSTFNSGGAAIPNSTLFRGMKFSIQNVRNAQLNRNGEVDSFALESSDDWDDWKFSIFLGEFDKDIDDDFSDITTDLNWQLVEKWRSEEIYFGATATSNVRFVPSTGVGSGLPGTADLVNYFDVLFQANQTAITELPTENPGNSPEWDVATQSTIFYNGGTYGAGDLVYNSGSYYFYDGIGTGDFWVPGEIYATSSTVIFNGNTWTSISGPSTDVPPKKNQTSANIGSGSSTWNLASIGVATTKWSTVPVFQSNKPGGYTAVDIVFGQDAVYKSLANSNTSSLNTASKWEFVYSIEPDTDRIYGDTKAENNIISLNGTWYKQLDTDHASTLDNGINIYINKKWKNVLINIYINDNTVPSIKNANRDVMYRQLNEKLSARNFMDSLNDLSKTYGFTNPVNYYIIEDDGSFVKYDSSNYVELPLLVTVEEPDRFSLDFRALTREIKSPKKNLIKSLKQLEDSEVKDIENIDYYNGSSLGVTFTSITKPLKKIPSEHGLKNIDSELMFRFSGPLTPIFKNVDLFKCPEIDNKSDVNYLFDTDFTHFGEIEEIISKVSRDGNILLFRDNEEERSVYPMIDEFGYTTKKHFIFKSTWDKKFFIETKRNI